MYYIAIYEMIIERVKKKIKQCYKRLNNII